MLGEKNKVVRPGGEERLEREDFVNLLVMWSWMSEVGVLVKFMYLLYGLSYLFDNQMIKNHFPLKTKPLANGFKILQLLQVICLMFDPKIVGIKSV